MKAKINPIEIAVMPLKVDAIERARQFADAAIERVRAGLAEHGNNINAAAPYPNSFHMGSYDYHTAKNRYSLFHSIAIADESLGYQVSNGKSPLIVVISDERCERLRQSYMKIAAQQYESFVHKLVAKIGDTKSAVLSGNHVWSHSELLVTLPDGTEQTWRTQQITNYSKLGKPFNQWPSRQVKAKAPRKVKEAA